MEKTFTEDLADLAKHEEDVSIPESQPEADKTEDAPSQTEKTAEVKADSPAEEKDIPFHKHPRWKRVQAELEELRKFKEEQASKTVEQPKVEKSPETVPAQYQKFFGDDVEAFKEWSSMMREAARAEAEQLIKQRETSKELEARKQAEAQQKAVSWAENQFLELTEETGIDMTDAKSTERNQILDICEKYGLFTAEGYPNVKKANELRSVLFPKASDEEVQEKKKVLTKTNAKSNAAPKEKDVWTPSELRKKTISSFFT